MAWAPDYCTATELKNYVRISDAADDTQVALAITAASRAVDHTCNRQFGVLSAAAERFYTCHWDRDRCVWAASIDDLQVTTDFAVKYSETSITDYTLTPRNSASEGRPWTLLILNEGGGPLVDELSVTAKWGWTAVPDPIKQATLMQASRFLARRDSPYGVTGSPEAGSELRLLSKLDPDVEVTVKRYRRWWGAV